MPYQTQVSIFQIVLSCPFDDGLFHYEEDDVVTFFSWFINLKTFSKPPDPTFPNTRFNLLSIPKGTLW